MRIPVTTWLMALLLVPVQAAAQQGEAQTDGEGEILRPEVLELVEPEYPSAALAARVSGTVVVGVALDAEGRIQEADVTQSTPMLDEAALAAVRQWQFAPPVVDGQPRPTGLNVAVEFAIGPFGQAPAAGPGPTWMPEDFAFDYVFGCRSGAGVSIGMQRYAQTPGAGPAEPADVPIAFDREDLESIYLRVFAAGAFAVPATTWRPDPGLHAAPDGFRLRVIGDLPIVPDPVAEGDRRSFLHVLDVRYYGAWRRVTWQADGRDPPADAGERLESIGVLIRRLVTGKPSVSGLAPAQRSCLEEGAD